MTTAFPHDHRPQSVFRRLAVTGVALACALLILHPCASAAVPKRVLVLQGEAPGLPGGKIIVERLEATLRQEFASPVEVYLEVLDTTRFSGTLFDERLAQLLAEKYNQPQALDLVVAFTSPAVDFVLRHRNDTFPGVPLLFGLIERRFLENRAVPNNAAAVFVQLDPSGTLRLALSLYPKTRKVIVVGGSSEFDRQWVRAVQNELRDSGPNIPVIYDTNWRLEDLVWMVGTLPADSIVLFISMTRDVANVVVQPPDVVEKLSKASSVPVFGLSTTYLGRGIVGGVLLDHAAHGVDLGRQAAKILKGEPLVQLTTPSTTAVDWRQMRRFGMSVVGLPSSTAIAFREPTLWERNKGTILLTLFIIGAQAALIAALIQLIRRRREAQQLVEDRLRFQTMSSEMTLALTRATPAEIDSVLEESLSRLAKSIGLDCAWRWRSDTERDREWDSPALRQGVALFDEPANLPPSIREKLRSLGVRSGWAIAVPVAAAARIVPGAVFWISHMEPSLWRVRTPELQMLSSMIVNVLQRRRAEASLEQSDALKGAILDSLSSQVAVLDRAGTVIAVNDSWLRFGRENGGASSDAIGVGSNYLETCRNATNSGDPYARQALTMIEAACEGQRGGQDLEYPCESPGQERWFLMRVEPLRRIEGGAVVSHIEITARKMIEMALRESEQRFRRMAEALPVGVWMSDEQGLCTYFNQHWLQMSGRTLEEEVGNGWLQAVHPDERARCMETYLAAFRGRRRFELEYRIRRFDGVYRWVQDIGMPRYSSDGTFHGYVGGAIDITERRDAEQLLHDFNRKLILAQEEERRHIARELHDHLSQRLALLAVELQQLSLNPPDSAEALTAALQDEWRHTSDIASDVHAISHRLHPSKLEALGLVTTLRGHCRDLSRQNLAVQFSEQNVSRVSPDLSLCIFRVAEEALTNVIRHSGATQAEVSLVQADGEIVLRVTDAGCGFRADPQRLRGIGLISIRERVHAVGGKVTISSGLGTGTTVEARLPSGGHRSASTTQHHPQRRPKPKRSNVADPA